MKISLFNHRADNVPKHVERNWSQITNKLRRPPIRKDKDGALWSPAAFDPPHRLLKNVVEVSMLVLDYDHDADFGRDLEAWRDYRYGAHTTFSHSEAEHRFRVLIPLTKPIPAAAFPRFFKWASIISGGKIDAAASDASRMFYVPVRRSESAPYLFEINESSTVLDWAKIDLPIPEVRSPVVQEKVALNLSAQELLEKAFVSKSGHKIKGLYDGYRNGHASHSEADLALCSHLAFWSGGDPSLLDQMFRGSKLYREKWDKRHAGNGSTYGQITIDKALSTCAEFYSGNGHTPASHAHSNEKDFGHSSEEAQRCTDLGNARRLVRNNSQDLRYCYSLRKWFVWNGRYWTIDESGEARRRAKNVVRSIFETAGDESLASAERQKYASWAIRSESDTRIEAMLSLAQSEPGMPVSTDELDRDVMLLSCRNGTIDLRSGELRKHDRGDLITRMIDIDYDASATCPRWDGFLQRIMAGNQALIDFLCRAIGYSLTGNTSERVLFILFGDGANGKSVFVETIAALLAGYARRTPTSTLMVKRNDAIPNDIARLRGIRLVHASESEQGKRLAESQIKDWTGGDTISARFLHCEYFEFKPEFKIWLRTNHKPKIVGNDEAIWDRIKLIPFNVRIEPHDQDKKLPQKLLTELPGILAWAVRGCIEWQRDGLGVPEEIVKANQQYRLEMDTFGAFVAECCTVGAHEWVASSDLRNAYESWAGDTGERHLLSGSDFQLRLKALGCEPKRTNSARGWLGIGLIVGT